MYTSTQINHINIEEKELGEIYRGIKYEDKSDDEQHPYYICIIRSLCQHPF